MNRGGLPNGAGVQAVVEEDDERATPVPAYGERTSPAPRPAHLVRREVQGVDLRLGQLVPAGDVALRPGLREPRRRVDKFLLGPRTGV